jgi:hypothetical protein
MLPGGGCPAIPAPSAPSAPATVQTLDGIVNTSWPSVGTDVWYYPWICDESKNNCATEGTKSPWVGAWLTSNGPLWTTQSDGPLDPIDATTTSGNSTNGDTFAIYIQSFGAGNGSGGGGSPEISVHVFRPAS